jgi:hypothetical protein
VRRSPGFRDHSGAVTPGSEYDDDLDDIIDRISQGHTLPERYYRAGIDRDHDDLLETEGVVHLHLGGRNSDVLLFLVQYPDRVVLLEINTHKHFATEPKGSLLRAVHERHLARIAQEVAAQLAEQATSIRASVDKLRKPRPPPDA